MSAYVAGPLEGPQSNEVCGFSNRPPTLANPGAVTSQLSQATTLQLQGVDPDGQPVTYGATGLPAGLALQSSTGFISGTPTAAGSFTVNATVSDRVLTASQSFTWTIAAPDATAPSVTITGPTSSTTFTTATSTLTLSGTAADNVAVAQVRLMWDANTESGIAGYFVHAGVQSAMYVQHYDVGLTTTYLFSNALQGQRYCFTVSAYFAGPVEGPRSAEVCGYANAAPTLASVNDQSSNAGQAVALQLAGSDPEGSVLTYSATGLPAGLSIAASTGLISGTPTTAGTSSVSATVSDGALTASRSFTWTVVSVDTTAPVVTITGPTSAPTLTTTASTVTVSGTASDSIGVTQVNWVNDRGGNGTANGTTSWSTAGIALQSGANVKRHGYLTLSR